MFELDIIWKLLLSVAVGAVIGMERETYRKPAGFRTNILICLGSTLFTIISVHMAGARADPGRVAAQIVTGVGFLGAGAIMRDGGRVYGLTTAATIWMVASLGMAVGAGMFLTAAIATVLALLVLRGFDLIENRVQAAGVTRNYQVRVTDRAALEEVAREVRESGLRLRDRRLSRGPGGFGGAWTAVGHQSQHDALAERLLGDERVVEFTW